MSWSYDLKTWTYSGRTDSGENVCVLVDRDEYVLIHSPRNGMGIKRSNDLKHWRDVGEVVTLGQQQWAWAENRLTAGFVLDLRDDPRVGKALMFFHGGGPGKEKTQDNVDANCSVGIAWSDDLRTWHWPGRTASRGAMMHGGLGDRAPVVHIRAPRRPSRFAHPACSGSGPPGQRPADRGSRRGAWCPPPRASFPAARRSGPRRRSPGTPSARRPG